ncbi:hypothetical protein POM88_046867 [Heracleum sosnowskyi]|uniref:Heme-binding protein 2 n=1 Tax=Heracleum sosnowskyi TaxID=360622 RepID=A0AAD8H9G6_9APIA|nr:hypothetical protein POM88_046867 [Heracleum sosnowskyi]
MYASKLMCASLLLSILVLDRVVASPPPPCSRLECPTYNLIDSGSGGAYEIRKYADIVLITTSPIQGEGFLQATHSGFSKLLLYILGKNDQGQKIEMAAPVVTQVSLSGSEAEAAYAVSFYIPQKFHANPPLPTDESLKIQRIPTTYAAVKQFSGFVSDTNVVDETNALIKSLSGTKYMDAINKSCGGDPAHNYFVGQYNSPFELFDRTNEIWLVFHM